MDYLVNLKKNFLGYPEFWNDDFWEKHIKTDVHACRHVHEILVVDNIIISTKRINKFTDKFLTITKSDMILHCFTLKINGDLFFNTYFFFYQGIIYNTFTSFSDHRKWMSILGEKRLHVSKLQWLCEDM